MNESIDKEISLLAQSLAGLLINQGKTVAVAESCTGGWLAKILTDLSGSSTWFLGGVVSYSNDAKRNVLHVKKACLEQFGAVSQEVAEQMADGVNKAFNSSISVSITGIAGPSGGTVDKPVGLVWFAVKTPKGDVVSMTKTYTGSRQQVRQQALLTALELLIDNLEK